jgi:hypothetical protein
MKRLTKQKKISVEKNVKVVIYSSGIGCDLQLCLGHFLQMWHSGHRICLRKRRPGFESHQGLSFRENIAMLLCIIDLHIRQCLCVTREKKRHWPKNID